MADSFPIKAIVIHRFDVSAESVFDAWTTSKHVRRWFAPGLGEMTRIAIDARESGSFIFAQKRGLEDVEHIGAYKAFARPHKLEFTWQVKGTPHSSLVTVDIAAINGGSELTLTHHLHHYWADYRERTEQSWRKMLVAMAESLQS